jgi:hypothetical protein
MRCCHGVSLGAMLLALAGCGGRPAEDPAPAGDARPFQEFLRALDNTLVEVNELERMGGGLRDRMILVDTESLVERSNQLRLSNALRTNYGKIRSLRASLKTNQGVGEVLIRNGHTLDQVVAIDAKSEGAVILYLTH